ncbi:sin3 binding protein [Stemphylium lycopersici]|uniref:Sin3 binding protein n=1 Tax=Stemphylium lycopersici TaxID=183478 RepID=A0A364NF90_STELY|nr:sin3 binding protein [Stemphylium lycopersici]RAR08840.1 sin3 binding protein [Stemphylium lycopersici]RAR15978.1 sin3 binding protein [Stemphylium lycopersici]
MATVARKPMSNIAMAFGRQDSGHATSTGTLPTPPSSISPTLPAHKRRPMPVAGRVTTPEEESMDIDLQDAVEHAAAQDQPSALSKEALAGLDATRQITALMLAKHHLPDIIVGHGAMPIREMMAHLTHAVPGFSGLPPAKARRLVVAALEHRAGGGLHGEVKFEKVGWGRWSVAGSGAQARGMPIGGKRSGNGQTPPDSVDSTGASLHIPKLRQQQQGDIYSGSWNAGSWSPHRHDDDEEMADQMSLDDESDGSSDSDSASDMELEEELNDDTDQEDWATMGPEALRETRRGPRREDRDYNYLSRTQTSNPRYRAISAQAHSLPQPHIHHAPNATPTFQHFLTVPNASRGNHVVNAGNSPNVVFTPSSTAVAGSGAERDAIEALIAMGSM